MREIKIIRNLIPLLRLHRRVFSALIVLGLLQSLSEGIGIGLFVPLLDLVVLRSQPRPGGHRLTDTVQRLLARWPPEDRLAVIVLCLFAAVLISVLLAYLYGAVS